MVSRKPVALKFARLIASTDGDDNDRFYYHLDHLGSPRRVADVCDVGCEFDDAREVRVLLDPFRHHLNVFRHLAYSRPHAAFGHSVRAAEIQFDAIRAGIFQPPENVFPRVLFHRGHGLIRSLSWLNQIGQFFDQIF